MSMNYTGIVLAGGASSRMGSNKALMDFNGHPLIHYPLALLSSFCDEMLISANQPGYEAFGCRVIPDLHAHGGPAAGVAATMNEASNEWVFVLSCDVPFVTREVFTLLMIEAMGHDGAFPVHGGKYEPLIGVYHRSLVANFEAALNQGVHKMQLILAGADVVKVDFTAMEIENQRLFCNFNRPEDVVGK